MDVISFFVLVGLCIGGVVYKSNVSLAEQRNAIFRKDLKLDRAEFLNEIFEIYYSELKILHFDGEYFYLPQNPQHFSAISRITLVAHKEVIIDKTNTELPHSVYYKYYTTSGRPSRRMDRRNPETPYSMRCVFRFEGNTPCEIVGFAYPDSFRPIFLDKINQFIDFANKHNMENYFRKYEVACQNYKKYQKEYELAKEELADAELALSAADRQPKPNALVEEIKDEQKKISLRIKELKTKLSTAESDKSSIIQEVKDLQAIEAFRAKKLNE